MPGGKPKRASGVNRADVQVGKKARTMQNKLRRVYKSSGKMAALRYAVANDLSLPDYLKRDA